MKKIVIIVICFILSTAAYCLNSRSKGETLQVTDYISDKGNEKAVEKIVVIDPGHGGRDPGKIGVTGVLEKDINLSISLKLKKLLEKEKVTVLMTRESDIGLYQLSDANKKRTDMKKRVEMINNSNANMAVSIHQNSFTKESSKGAQVFYYTMSDVGKEIAGIIQEQLKVSLTDENRRLAKENDSYYMLRKTQCPLVIVECGFLSNREEETLLNDEKYQEQLAEAIKIGIISALNKNT